MNNKKLGMQFEKEFCKHLDNIGCWVHFINPDVRGSQPFDVIAVKDGKAFAYDCKTSVSHLFPITRLEANQIFAFDKWIKCGNPMPHLAVKYEDKIYLIPYDVLKERGKVDLNDFCGYE